VDENKSLFTFQGFFDNVLLLRDFIDFKQTIKPGIISILVLINKGSKDNIQSGNIYTIKRGKETESVYDVKTGLDIAPVLIGRLIVLHTESASATVMLLSSTQDIHPGDIVN